MTDDITITPNLNDAVTAALAYVVQARALVAQAEESVVAAATVATTVLNNHFYGQFTSAPGVRPDSTPIQDGDQYYDLTLRALRMRINGSWQNVAVSASAGALLASANLHDLSSVADALSALGIGTAGLLTAGAPNGAATLDSSGHVPSAQANVGGNGGLLKGSNLADLTDPAAAAVNLNLGTAAFGTLGSTVATLSGGKVPVAQLPVGTASGVASLDSSGHVPLSQLNAGNPSGIATLTAGGILDPSQFPAGSPTSLAKSADYTTIAGDAGKVISVTTGSSTDKTITLVSAITAGDGALMIVQKVDSGTNKVIVNDGSTARAWLSNQWDIVAFRSDGSGWRALWVNIAPRVDTFTVSGTWTKPPLLSRALVKAIAAGGGGGGGGKPNTDSAGGGGGGGGSFYQQLYVASDLASTESVVVGVGGTAGTAGALGGTGGTGGLSSFGSTVKFSVGGGLGGFGGGNSGGSTGGNGGSVFGLSPASGDSSGFLGAGDGNSALGFYGGACGGDNLITFSSPGGGSAFSGGGGGAGGGSSSSSGVAGGAGGITAVRTTGGGGAGGAAGNHAGSAGVNYGSGGGGGGGGGGSATAAAGGVGGVGGGGGGGGSVGNSLGTPAIGGAGGRGQVDVISYFSV